MRRRDPRQSSTPGHRLAALLALALTGTIMGCPFKVETFQFHCLMPEDCDDGNECTEDTCEAGVCGNELRDKGAACGSGKKSVCDGKGECVQCLTNKECTTNHMETPICDLATQTCVSCTDGKKNGKETNVDCGGPDCGACLGQPCHPENGCGNVDGKPAFCVMPEGLCCDKPCDLPCEACALAKTGMPNGTCGPVPYSQDPDMECVSLGGCGATPGKCRCTDGVKNTDESDVDCGGTVCAKCGGGKMCNTDDDCAATVPACVNGACCESSCAAECRGCDVVGQCVDLPAGSPHVKCSMNQACGPNGAGCIGKAGSPCAGPLDCLSSSCSGVPKTCQKGGPGAACNDGNDCISGGCGGFICQ